MLKLKSFIMAPELIELMDNTDNHNIPTCDVGGAKIHLCKH